MTDVGWINLVKNKQGRSQWPRGLKRGSAADRLLGLQVRIPPGHGCLSLVSVVCCQVEVPAPCWSLVKRSPTECGVSWLWSWSINNEALAHYGLSGHGEEKNRTSGRFLSIFFFQCPPHVLVDFVVFPPGHGRSLTDFWGWDAHEARLRCPDDVSGDIGGCSARRALKPKFY